MKNIYRSALSLLFGLVFYLCLCPAAHAADTVQIPYNGKTMTVCLASFQNGKFHAISRMGDSFPAVDDPSDYRYGQLPWFSQQNLYVMAFQDFGNQEKERPAPADFVNAIKNVSVRLEFLDASQQGNASVSQLNQYDQFADYPDLCLTGFRLNTIYRTPFILNMHISFKYKSQAFTVTVGAFYRMDPDRKIEAGDLVSSEQLNSVLSDKDRLKEYIDGHTVPFDFNEGTVELILPPVTYQEIIVCDVSAAGEGGRWFVKLTGSDGQNGTHTVMRGLEVRSGLGFVENIQFAEDKLLRQSDGFTCGILYNGNLAKDMMAWTSNHIGRCTFTGFEFGIHATETGYCGSVGGCVFQNCGHAIMIDCGNLPQAAGNASIDNNIFRGNTTSAITIKGLPQSITSYLFSIHDNTFVNNNCALRKDNAGVLLPEELKTVEAQAFEGTKVKTVYIQDNVTTIQAQAFANCSKLQRIRIPASVTEIDDSAFQDCNSKLTIYGPSNSEAQMFALGKGITFAVDMT